MKMTDSFSTASLQLALEPRVMFDAAAASTAAEVAAVSEASTPDVDATAAQGQITIAKDGTPSGAVDLFSGVTVTNSTGNEEFSTVQITVDTFGDGQMLVVDGTEVKLVSGAKGEFGSDYYEYKVALADGKAVVTLDVYGASADEVASIIDSLGYKVTNGAKATVGQVTVSVTAIAEVDTSDTNKTIEAKFSDLNAVITVSSDYNYAPVIDNADGLHLADQIAIAGLDTATQVVYAQNGELAFAADADGNVSVLKISDGKLTTAAVFTKDQIAAGITNSEHSFGKLTDMAVTKDGSHAYLLSNNTIFVLDFNGEAFSFKESFKDNSKLWNDSYGSYMSGSKCLTLSEDGSTVFVGDANGLFYFTVNADGSLASQDNNRLHDTQIRDGAQMLCRGDYLFTAESQGWDGNSVTVYQKQADGTWKELGKNIFEGDITGYDTQFKMAVSEDGKKGVLVVIGEDWGEDYSTFPVYECFTFTFDGDCAVKGATVSGIENVADMVMTKNGDAVYILTTDGVLTKYAVGSDGSLKAMASQTGLKDGAALSLSPTGDLLVGGEAVSLFAGSTSGVWGSSVAFADQLSMSDKNLDAKASGEGDYTGASFTVKSSDAAGVFSFSRDGYSLSGTNVMKDGRIVASVTVNAGGVLTVTFRNSCTTAEANDVLQGWTYRTSSADAVRVSLAVSVSDGEKTSDAVTLDFTMHANQAPNITADPADNKTFDTAGDEFSLFNKVVVNAGDSDQALKSVTFTVTGDNLTSCEYLSIGGVKIALDKNAIVTAASGAVFTYTVSDGRGTLVMSNLAVLGTTEVATLLAGAKYGNTSDSAMTGVRTFAVTSVTDNGGTVNGGKDTATVDAVSVTVDIAVNNAPVIDIENQTNADLFYHNGTVTGMESNRVMGAFEANGGKTILVIGNSSAWGNGAATLFVYSRDTTTGALTLVQTFAEGGDYAGLYDLSTLKVTSDGTVYVAGAVQDNSRNCALVRFTLDADSGMLAYQGVVALQGENGVTGLNGTISDIEISADGKTLYTVNGLNGMKTNSMNVGSSVAAFSINADGSLTLLADYTGDDSGVSKPSAMALSPDGKQLYVTNASSLAVFEVNDNGTLTLQTEIKASDISGLEKSGWFNNLAAVEVSQDGKYVFVRGGTMSTFNVVNVFSRAGDGSVAYVETFNIGTHGGGIYGRGDMHLSVDGASLVLTSFGKNEIIVCAIDRNTGHLSVSDTVTSATANMNFVLTSDGKNIYGGTAAWSNGLYAANSMAVLVHTTTGNLPLSGVTVSDRDADAKAEDGDYENVTVTIERKGGASEADVFVFADADGYSAADGKVYKDGAVVASMTNEGGRISFTFASGVTKATANAVLARVGYTVTETTDAKVQMQVTLDDGDGKTASAFFGIVEAPAFELIDTVVSPTVYPADGGATTFLDNVTIRQNASEASMEGAKLTIVSSDGAAIFGAGEGYSLSEDGQVLKGETVIGAYAKASGRLVVTFAADVADIAGVNAFLQSLTYTASTVTDGATVTFGVSFQDASGNSTSGADVAQVYFNAPPAVNDACKDWTPDEVVLDTPVKTALPSDFFVDDLDKTLDIKLEGLPEGLAYVDGFITGTAVMPGVYTITATATDSMNRSVETTFTLTVRDNSAPAADPSFALPEGSISSGYEADLSKAFADKEGDAFTVKVTSELPAGLSFDAATGRLSGLPLYPGDYAVTLVATDVYGKASAEVVLVLRVADMDVVILPDAGADGQFGSDKAALAPRHDAFAGSEADPFAPPVAPAPILSASPAPGRGSAGPGVPETLAEALAENPVTERLAGLFAAADRFFEADWTGRDAAAELRELGRREPVKAEQSAPEKSEKPDPLQKTPAADVPAETAGDAIEAPVELTPSESAPEESAPAEDSAPVQGKQALSRYFRDASLYEEPLAA